VRLITDAGTEAPMRVLMRRLRALRPETLRAAWWAWRAAGYARRVIHARPITDVRLPAAPRIGPDAERGVSLALRRRGATCLESALVRQAMLAARGIRREVVIGVDRTEGTFRAHAWLDGEPVDPRFTELMRAPHG
jgi:Transglutaminase-like superfamily